MKTRNALSLLEVILALVILAGSMATIGEMVRHGTDSARIARDESKAQLLCESKLSEITAGAVALVSVGLAEFEWDLGGSSDGESRAGEWLYAVDVSPLDQPGLLQITVTVVQSPDVVRDPVEFTLVRWMVDPDAVPAESEAEEESTDSTDASSGGDDAAN